MIISLFLGDTDIYKILRSELLTIWRKKLTVSPSAYDLVHKLVVKKIKFLKRVLTKKEHKMIDGRSKNKGIITYNKNELRRRGLYLICKGPLALNH